MERENYWNRAGRRRLSRRTFLVRSGMGAAGLAGAAALGAACGGGGSGGGTDVSGSLTQRTAVPPEEQKPGGVLTMTHEGDPPHLDPHAAESYLTIDPMLFVYEGVTRHVEPEQLGVFEIVPQLASALPEQPDDTTFVITLPEGAVWHDVAPVNGRPVTAEDVKYSYERLQGPETYFRHRPMFALLDKVEAVDARTARVTLKQPLAPFPMYMANPWSVIVPHEVVEEKGDLKQTAVGTGPFMLKSWQRAQSLEFVRNPGYYQADRPFLDGISWQIMPDPTARLNALRTGQLQVGSVGWADIESFKRSNGDYRYQEYPIGGQYQAWFNTSREPFKDQRVRQAVQAAIDYDAAIDLLALGHAEQNGPVQWWLKEFALPKEELPKRDLAKAKQLLEAAGFPDGFEATVSCSTVLAGDDIAQVLQEQLREVDIKVNIDVIEWAAFLQRLVTGEFEIGSFIDWTFSDPDRYLYPYHTSTKLPWAVAWPDLDELLDKQRLALDPDERKQVIDQIQHKMLEYAPNIWLFTPTSTSAVAPQVQNVQVMADNSSFYRQFGDISLVQ